MGCIHSKSNDSNEISYIKKMGFYKFKSYNSKQNCCCFDCFKKNKPRLEEDDNKKIDGIDLVRVTLPSVKINDLQTPIEKLRKSFKGVYMRDKKGLNSFIDNAYISNEKKDENDDDDKPVNIDINNEYNQDIIEDTNQKGID
tara:strand:- start:9 stop:434 length:426 start_codon:yes stop_codon:yes gene_type:complete